MIQYQQGDILQADAEALVNTVNCVGIMGRGIALQFRKEFPENYKTYKAVCDRKELHPGMILVFNLNRLENPRFVFNFPTKRHWKGKSRIEDIRAGLEALVEEVRQRGITSVAVPPLGCGLWNGTTGNSPLGGKARGGVQRRRGCGEGLRLERSQANVPRAAYSDCLGVTRRQRLAG